MGQSANHDVVGVLETAGRAVIYVGRLRDQWSYRAGYATSRRSFGSARMRLPPRSPVDIGLLKLVAQGRDCPADIAMLRAKPEPFGPSGLGKPGDDAVDRHRGIPFRPSKGPDPEQSAWHRNG